MALMQIDLAFGKTGLAVDTPERLSLSRSGGALGDPAARLASRARSRPRRPDRRAASRRTRARQAQRRDLGLRYHPSRAEPPDAAARAAPPGAGRHPARAITILIATGLHRPATDAEIREICGEEIAAAYRVVNHDARNLSSHRHLGSTASGTPVYIDERFIAADLHITLGFIEPHLMLGLFRRPQAGRARTGRAGDHQGPAQPEIHARRARRRGLDRGQPAASRTARDRPHGAPRFPAGRGAGPRPLDRRRLRRATRSRRTAPASSSSRSVMLETLDEPADAAITTSAGYPLDLTYYQAIKGVTAASHIVKPGGSILLAAACAEGAGAPEFRRMLRDGVSDAEFLERIARRSGDRRPVAARETRAGHHAAQAALARPRPARPSITRACGDDRTRRSKRRSRRSLDAAAGRERRRDSGRSVRAREGARARNGRSLKRNPHG